MSQVSCRVLGVVFDALAERGIEPGLVIGDLPYTEKQLREPRRRIGWEELVGIVSRLEDLVGGVDQLEQIGYEHLSTPSYANIRRVASFFTSPRDLYWLGTSWFGPNLFGITNDRVETLPDGRILEVIEIPEPYSPCNGLFHIIRGALRATPSLIGMPDSLVEADIEPRRASFIISPPVKRFSVRQRLRRLFSTRRASHHFVEELALQQRDLTQANQSLERTVRELRESAARLTAIIELDSDVRYALRMHPDGRRDQLWLTGRLASLGQEPLSHDLTRSGASIHPADRTNFEARFDTARDQSIFRVRYRVTTAEGKQHWIQESIRREPQDGDESASTGEPEASVLFHGTLKDVSAQARAEADLHRLVAAVDQANDGIVVVAPNFEVVYANSAFHRLVRRGSGSLIGHHIRDELGAPSSPVISSLEAQVLRKGIGRGRVDFKTKHGTPAIVDATVAAVYGEGEVPESYVGIIRDVTREVELEGQIRFASHMDALGQLAGGLAHDFNNLLMVIHAESEMLLRRKSTDDAARLSLTLIGEAAEQGEHLVHQLFTLSRIEKDDPQPLDANDIVEGFVSFVRGALSPEITIQPELSEHLSPIHFGRGRLLQILVNLAFNARDAMPEGGLVTVATAMANVDAERASRLQLSAGPHVSITIRDSGVGMTPEIQSRIFEPLYSTKELGQGAGMGLTTAMRSMQDVNGAIEVESQVGRGSSFSLYFPVAGGELEAESDAPKERGSAGRR